jgi:hypothetical protein
LFRPYTGQLGSVNGASPENSFVTWKRAARRALKLADLAKLGASCRMPVHSTVKAAHCPAAEQLLLTIGRAGVLSRRAIATGELETLLSLLGPQSERQRSDLQRATDIVLVENDAVIYWPRTGAQFHIADAAYAMARVQATLA